MKQLKTGLLLSLFALISCMNPSDNWSSASLKVEIAETYYNKIEYTCPDKLTIDERNSLSKRGGEPVLFVLTKDDQKALHQCVNNLLDAKLSEHYGFGNEIPLGIVYEISVELKDGGNVTLLINQPNDTLPTPILNYISQFNRLKEKYDLVKE